MNVTAAFTGALPIIIIVSAVLTALVSVSLLWLYRRAVVRAMNVQAQAGIGATSPKSVSTSTAVRTRSFPVLAIIDSASQPEIASAGKTAYHQAMRSLKQAALVYAIAGLVYALILTSAWMITAGGGFIVVRFLLLLSYYTWPIVLVVSLLIPTGRSRFIPVYFAILLAVAIIGLIRNPDLTARQLVYLWFFANGPGSVLLLAFLHRRVRAVGPLVLAFMVAAVTGAVVIVSLVGSSQGLMRGVVNVGSVLGMRAMVIFIMLHVIGFGLFGLLGWPLLRRLGRRYQEKRMSDQSISLDALWLLFGVVQSFTLVFEGWAWIFTGLVAFVGYKLALRICFTVLSRDRRDSAKARLLLLLRVFSLGQRSERLFDMISNVWLRSGSIALIAGPDLVTSTVEPHEFLNFLSGRLSRQFVEGEADLEQRVSRMDTKPDPDGRHRVNEFFCRADTWQMTMQQLAGQSNAVLMDLRSFSKSNQGCIYELQQLMNNIPLSGVVLVIDDSTDRTFLEMAVRKIWQNLEASSPNVELSEPTVRCFSVKQQSPAEMERLLLILFNAQTAVG
jgi:hypothetical protein